MPQGHVWLSTCHVDLSVTAPAGTGCMRQPIAIQVFCGLDPKWVAPFSTSWVFCLFCMVCCFAQPLLGVCIAGTGGGRNDMASRWKKQIIHEPLWRPLLLLLCKSKQRLQGVRIQCKHTHLLLHLIKGTEAALDTCLLPKPFSHACVKIQAFPTLLMITTGLSWPERHVQALLHLPVIQRF